MNTSFRIGEFLIEPQLNNIINHGQSIHVEPKVMQVLSCLSNSAGDVVAKDQIIKVVWADTFVGDDVLTRAISELRKVFGDDSKEPRYIQTIPRTGYRLIAPVVHDQAKTESTLITFPSTTLASRGLLWAILLLALTSIGVWLYVSRPGPSAAKTSMRVIPFTSFPGREDQGVLSPDGNQIAFVWEGEKDDNADIYVKSVSGERPLRITTDPALDLRPAWSPDGQRICFLRIGNEPKLSIFVASALAAAPERLLFTVNHDPGTLSWSPDGKLIATSDASPGSKNTNIILFSVDTGEKRNLTTLPPQYWSDTTPAFSPDNKYVAFIRQNSPITGDIYVVPTTGGEPRRVTFDNARYSFDSGIIGGLAWTSDGSELIFSSTRGGLPSLWRVALAGGEPERLPVGGDNSYYPSVSLQGHRLSYTRVSGGTPIYRIEATTQPNQHPAATKFLSSTREDASPRYSPDGKRVVFQSDRTGNPEIWMCDNQGRNLTQLTFFRKGVAGTAQWSPDGSQIAFDYRASGMSDVYVINVTGGVPRRVTTEDSDDSVPSWSRDGKYLYFASNRTGSLEIWKTPVEGGPAVQITRHGGFTAFESTDGHYIYYAKNNGCPGVWRSPAEGGDETLVLNDGGAGNWGQWTLADNGIYFINYKPEGLSVSLYNLATKKVTRVVELANVNTFLAGLATSPNGKEILYTQQDSLTSDIMLVEDFR
ncbi:MAG TPA: winged helix-turn-helix domain-containing protein [Pyrinomonadaceae bacterium]|nr:winged helix-turn-helix domain-containing protein [Pyrinomonadaceae bacterium]